jgi:hypothetical protein
MLLNSFQWDNIPSSAFLLGADVVSDDDVDDQWWGGDDVGVGDKRRVT